MKIKEAFKHYRKAIDREAVNPERADYAWKHLQRTFGNLDADDNHLISGAATRYVVTRRSKSAADGTINRELSVLQAVLRRAFRDGLASSAPALPSTGVTARRRTYLTQDEIEAFLAAAEDYPHVLTFIRLGLLTGQRYEALLGLKWDQIDWAAKLIYFMPDDLPMKHRRKGRGIVPLGEALEKVLNTLLLDRQMVFGKSSPYVIEYRGDRLRDIRRSWKIVRERAGLPASVTPHVMRHTLATRLLARGAGLLPVSRLLGHKDSRVTESVYYQFQPEFLAEIREMTTLERG